MRRWIRAIFVAPAWGALCAVIFSFIVMAIDDRHRESYWPIITEMWLFGLSYVGFWCVNLVVGAPASAFASHMTSNLSAGIAIGLCQGIIAGYFGLAAKLFPSQFHLLAVELWLAVIIPLLVTGLLSFIYLRNPQVPDKS